MEYPSNAKNPQNKPKIEKVVQGEVSRKKRSLGKRLKETFIGGDSRSVIEYVFLDVLVPAAKDMFTDAASQGFERLIYGEDRARNRRTGYRPGPIVSSGYTNYTRYSSNKPARDERPDPRMRTRDVRSYEDIVCATRIEADNVLQHMFDLLRQYDTVTVADLYSLVGLSGSYTDANWGWNDLQGSAVSRIHGGGGYALELPKPQPLD